MTSGVPHLGDGSRFSIQRRIGAGSNGVVYEAYDRHRHSVVAVKTLKQVTPQGILHFKGEFRSLARLDQHRNLIQLHELLFLDGQWLITMELVDGVNFLQWVRPIAEEAGPSAPPTASTVWDSHQTEVSSDSDQAIGTPPSIHLDRSGAHLDPEKLRSAFRQLCEGVVTLHRAGKVHRDLKPANVLVTRDGRVVILDFGLVADAALAGAGTEFAGTPSFMAPEQFTGRALPASDWYAAGVMLCQALTGKLPFYGSTSEMAAQKNGRGIGDSVGLCEALPEDLATLSRGLMSAQPGLRPTTTQILVAAGVSDRSPSTALTTTLVGRETDLRQLSECLDAVRTGKTVIARILGISGVGKTALTRAFIQWTMRFRDTLTLQGRCHERESVPFKALDSVVDDLVRFLMRLPDTEVDALLPRDPQLASRLFPVLDLVPAIAHAVRREPEDSDSAQRRRAGLAALRELLGRIANRRTLVVHIDDVHWGDGDSASALCEILRQPDAPPMLLVLSGRGDRERNVFLDAFDAENQSLAGVQIETIHLRELDRDAAIKLAAQLLPLGEPIGPDKIAAEARGNPFLIGELAREVQFQGLEAALSFETLVAKRLTQLSAEARRVLEVSALAGQPLPVETARQAADIERLDTAVLYELEHLHLARMTEFEGAPAIDCYHDRVRQVLLATLPPDRARVNHRELARALEATGASQEALAMHFHAAGESERAIEHALKAADHALTVLAFESAVRLYRLVLSLLPPDDTQRTQRQLVKLGDALSYAGRSYEAAHIYLKADALCTGDEQLEVRRRALHQLLTTAHFDEALALARKLLAAIGLRLPTSRLGTLATLARYRLELRFHGLDHQRRLASSASPTDLVSLDTSHSLAFGLGVVDTLRGAVFQAQHTLMALRIGDPFRASRALASEAAYRSIKGRKSQPEVNRLLDRARQLAVESGQPYASAACLTAEGIAATEWGEFRRALQLCDDASRALRPCPGSEWERITAHVFALFSLYSLGEWSEYRKRSLSLVEDATRREDLYAQTTLSLFAYAKLLADDDPEGAEIEQRQRISRWRNPTFDLQQFFLAYGMSEIDLYRGRAAAATERVNTIWPVLKRSLLLRVHVLSAFAHYLRARCAIATALNGDKNALKIARRSARALEQHDLTWNSGFADALYAGIESVSRNTEGARIKLDSARVKLSVAAMPTWLAAVSHLQTMIEPTHATGDTTWFSTQGVRDPDRLSALLVPGIVR